MGERKALDVQARLEYARTAVAVLRALQIMDTRIRYHKFAKAIGLMAPDEDWQAWHRHQIGDILYLVAAVEKQAGEPVLQCDRIINEQGIPGAGYYRNSSIVVTTAASW